MRCIKTKSLANGIWLGRIESNSVQCALRSNDGFLKKDFSTVK